jgi:putative heme-binding domain-containing protein
MPHAGSVEIDPRGVTLIGHWIASLAPTPDQTAIANSAKAKEQSAAEAIGSASNLETTVDALLSTSEGALALSRVLGDRPHDSTVARVAQHAYKNEKPEVRDLFARFVPSTQRIKTLGPSFRSDAVLTLGGDATRGHAVFAVLNGGTCVKCHRVNNEGESFGPDLSHVGTKYDRAHLLENIVEPSKTIAQGFTTTLVKMKHGEPQMGILISRTEKELVLKTAANTQVTLAIPDIYGVSTQQQSLMPEGLLGGLTAQQAADLLEYLQSLK